MPASMPQVACNCGTIVGPPPASTEIAWAPVPCCLIPLCTLFVSVLQLQIPSPDALWMIQGQSLCAFSLHVPIYDYQGLNSKGVESYTSAHLLHLCICTINARAPSYPPLHLTIVPCFLICTTNMEFERFQSTTYEREFKNRGHMYLSRRKLRKTLSLYYKDTHD